LLTASKRSPARKQAKVEKDSPESFPPYLRPGAEGSLLKVLLRPRSRSEKIEGPQGDCLKVSVTAPPVEGKANEALLRFLSSRMGLRRSQLSIRGGHRAVRKLIAIEACSPRQVLDRLKIPLEDASE
jgi:uncharacterized protein